VERDTLAEILAIEKQIRDGLDGETAKASRWLDGVRQEVERAKLEGLVQLEESVRLQEAAATQATQEKAGAIVRDAEAEARRIAALDSDWLAAMVRRHVSRIVAGGRA
jgi:hypothetical protein